MFFLGFLNNLFQGDGLILLFLILLLFGAKKLPELARGLGSAINEFNKAKDDVQRQIVQAAEPPPSAPIAPATPAPATEPAAPAAPQAQAANPVPTEPPKA